MTLGTAITFQTNTKGTGHAEAAQRLRSSHSFCSAKGDINQAASNQVKLRAKASAGTSPERRSGRRGRPGEDTARPASSRRQKPVSATVGHQDAYQDGRRRGPRHHGRRRGWGGRARRRWEWDAGGRWEEARGVLRGWTSSPSDRLSHPARTLPGVHPEETTDVHAESCSWAWRAAVSAPPGPSGNGTAAGGLCTANGGASLSTKAPHRAARPRRHTEGPSVLTAWGGGGAEQAAPGARPPLRRRTRTRRQGQRPPDTRGLCTFPAFCWGPDPPGNGL